VPEWGRKQGKINTLFQEGQVRSIKEKQHFCTALKMCMFQARLTEIKSVENLPQTDPGENGGYFVPAAVTPAKKRLDKLGYMLYHTTGRFLPQTPPIPEADGRTKEQRDSAKSLVSQLVLRNRMRIIAVEPWTVH